MLASFKRSLQAARSFEEVHNAAAEALPRLRRARSHALDRSELAEVSTLYTGAIQAPPLPRGGWEGAASRSLPGTHRHRRALRPLAPRGAEPG